MMSTPPYNEEHPSQIPALIQLVNLGYGYCTPAHANGRDDVPEKIRGKGEACAYFSTIKVDLSLEQMDDIAEKTLHIARHRRPSQ